MLGVDAVDGRRFRMNFGVDGIEPHAEDGWLGRRVAVGEAVVVPQGNVGRCVVTTQNPDTGRTDLDTLKALAAYRGDVETTEPLPFGVHAAVAEPGRVRRRRPRRNPVAGAEKRRPAAPPRGPGGFTGGGEWDKVGSSGPSARRARTLPR